MQTTDAAFLAEVEDFLVSCDLPTFPVSTDQNNATPGTCSCGKKKKKRAHNSLDVAAKLELSRAKDRKRRNAYRQRRLIEKHTLQRQVEELSTTLNDLQKTKGLERFVPSTTWKTIAMHQLQARFDTEAEQRRLCSAIESRVRMVSEFRDLVQIHLTNAINDGQGDLDENLRKPKSIRPEPSDAEFFGMYLRELDLIYEQTDKVLSTMDLASTDETWCDPRQRWKKNKDTGGFTYTDKLLLPLEFKHACRYIWGAAQLQHRQEDRQYFVIAEEPELTTALKFRITTRLKSGRMASTLHRAIARRYVEDGRMVVVWKTFSEGEGLFSDMHVDETGWCVSTPTAHPEEPSTLLRTVMWQVPMHLSTASTRKPAAEEFTGLLLNAGSEDVIEIGTRLEELQLQDNDGGEDR